MAGKLLLVIKTADAESVLRRIAEKACMGWERQVEIYPVCERRSARKQHEEPVDYNTRTDQLIDLLADGDYSAIIVQAHVAIDVTRLAQVGIRLHKANSLDVLVKLIFDELRKRKLDWLTHATYQWEKSAIRSLHPDAWAQQFDALGVRWIGTNLLKLLRVVADDELRSAFLVPEAEFAGLKVVHAYFRDPEPGSSSLNVKMILEKLYPASQVIEYDPEQPDCIDGIGKDIIFVYEDGLWSGVELVRRLNNICKNSGLRNAACQIHFRYAVTSDAGLIAGRLFSKRERLQNIQLRPATASYHYDFLQNDAFSRLQDLANSTDDEIRHEIDSLIRPLAFQSDQFWSGRRDEALQICTHLGRQLVSSFLERRRDAKRGQDGAALDPIPEEKLMGWALGALRFGSTVSFSSSVPKPVLPLMWLAGPVRIDGREIDWKPLFWDVRRTAAIDYPDRSANP
ncbi:phosphoribosyltransferase-like protein [Pseudoduganella chitinolytica]|uniref:PRTase-CE domain-containing protein n=1 Tax=Pseudoduganella chitinolytica TaxID=34070 RepID=A0ABY8BKU1_9BURK|nr:hypothetical protein [Pseudoduganella chitinolytica]WEF35526.1 hypothetical protein PX653_12490 [Pseudoduganella chitinolytica]